MDVSVYGALCREGEERALARRLLAAAAAREWGLGPLPEIARGERGKPYFPSFPRLHFNLSHSHGAAVCAVHDQPVGVDVERLRPPPKRLAGGMGAEDFFRLWTAKEATAKREGKGISALLGVLEPDPRCRLLEGFLPGWVVTVCPSKDAPVRVVQVKPWGV